MCGDQEMMANMNTGGDVCCDYTDGRLCGTFPTNSTVDTAEECAETGSVTTDSETLRLPLRRGCNRWVVAIRFPHANVPRASALDEAFLVLPIHPQSNGEGPVSLKIYAEADDNSAPLTNVVRRCATKLCWDCRFLCLQFLNFSCVRRLNECVAAV